MTSTARSVRARLDAWVTVAIVASAATAHAQTTPPDPASRARLRFGSLRFNPVLDVKNLGVDTNVFNDPENPRRDFTATVSPSTDIFLRAGLLRADARVSADLMYYRQYASERSSNTVYTGLFSAASNRLTPYVGAEYTSTRQRPGYEVDERARHTTTRYRIGSDVRVGARTTVGLDLARATTAFRDDETFRGRNLAEQLNRRERVGRLTLRHALTPLTRAVASVDAQSDRFDSITTRNSDSYRVTGGLELEPVALVSGTATVGYRKVRFLDPAVEDVSGLVAAVNVGYTIFALTRLGLTAARDTQYSYDPERPYYVQTGFNLVVTQRLLESWDVQATAARQRLRYSGRFGAGDDTSDPDRVTQYGIGLGYRLGRDTRVGVAFTRSRRLSPDPLRRYEGNQVGTSITYGS